MQPAPPPLVRCASGPAVFRIGAPAGLLALYQLDGKPLAAARAGQPVRINLDRVPHGRHVVRALVLIRDRRPKVVIVLRFTRC